MSRTMRRFSPGEFTRRHSLGVGAASTSFTRAPIAEKNFSRLLPTASSFLRPQGGQKCLGAPTPSEESGEFSLLAKLLSRCRRSSHSFPNYKTAGREQTARDFRCSTVELLAHRWTK